MGTTPKRQNNKINSLCEKCAGQCCKVGFIVTVFPNEPLYDDDAYVNKSHSLENGAPFHNMKSNGDGYTCIALGSKGECTIWSRRPQMCRDFEVNGPRCIALRKEYGRP